MKYFQRLLLFLAITISAVGIIQATAFADDSDTITDAQLVQIRNRCSEIQTTLSHVHANDALLRVNRGQLYERISTKLMAPLNSRIVLNKLDSTSLVAVTTKYETDLKKFRVNYQAYEELLSDTMKINCVNQPTRFYDSLQQARAKRGEVYKSTQDLTTDITEYKQAFDEFAKPYKEGTI